VTFLAPGYLVAAAAVAATIVLLHFLSTRQPRTVPLPTARFAPDRVVRAQTRAIRLQDVALMTLRAALVLAVGGALGRPVLQSSRRSHARILLVDRSRAVARGSEAADSLRALSAPGDAVVVFDEGARLLRNRVADSATVAAPTFKRGNLSAALIAALRAASSMRDEVDSVELAIISPLAREEFDAATDSIRALWPGRIRLVPVAAHAGPAAPAFRSLASPPGDPLRYALAGASEGTATARVVRGALGAADSAWARATGHVLVAWPASAAQPPGALWTRRSVPDTVGAVTAGDDVVVAPFSRVWTSAAAEPTLRTRVAARWVDGDIAATEELLGEGCLRTVAIDVPSRGDLVLEPRFTRFAAAMTEPCGGSIDTRRAGAARTTELADSAARPFVRRADIMPAPVPTPLARWLLLAAAALAFVEMIVRRSRTANAMEFA
jgi:hypothetical protein